MTINLNDKVQVINPEREQYGMRGRVVTISHDQDEKYRVKLNGVDRRIDFEESELEVVVLSQEVGKFRKGDRVIIKHRGEYEGRHGTVGANLGDGYHIVPDGHQGPGGVFFVGADLELIKPVMEDRPAELKKDRVFDPMTHARKLVWGIFYNADYSLDDVYIVWFAYILGGWKVLISTNVKDNCYYEVTHNVAKNETYVDKYVKVQNVCVDENTNRWI